MAQHPVYSVPPGHNTPWAGDNYQAPRSQTKIRIPEPASEVSAKEKPTDVVEPYQLVTSDKVKEASMQLVPAQQFLPPQPLTAIYPQYPAGWSLDVQSTASVSLSVLIVSMFCFALPS
jgi:hypothetical protein